MTKSREKYSAYFCLKSCALIFSIFFTAQIIRAEPINAENSQIEVGFSPEGSAEQLILKLINSAHSSINMAAYSFSSVPIAKALINAQRRGVKVAIILDKETNLQNNSASYALKLLSRAGISLRMIDIYKIHHDKYIVVDKKDIETGSYNYTKSAAKYNSENVIIIWNKHNIANQYLQHWQNRWNDGYKYSSEP